MDVDQFKILLGSQAWEYTDAELRQLKREMEVLAELLLDIYQNKMSRNGGNRKDEN